MRRILLIIVTLFLFNSCMDNCRYFEPKTICGEDIKFEILDSLDNSVFDSVYVLDSLLIINEFNDTINPKLFTDDRNFRNDNQFSFEIFDCKAENDKFNKVITKIFLLRFSPLEIDTIRFEFYPVNPAGECGGTDFDFLKIRYNNRTYDGSHNLNVNRVYK